MGLVCSSFLSFYLTCYFRSMSLWNHILLTILTGRKATLHLIHHVILSYYISAWPGKDASRLSILLPPSVKEKISGPYASFCTQQTIALMIFSLFIMQLNDRIHFHHVFSWHLLNVWSNFKYHAWKLLANRGKPLWIHQEKKKKRSRNMGISTSSLTLQSASPMLHPSGLLRPHAENASLVQGINPRPQPLPPSLLHMGVLPATAGAN